MSKHEELWKAKAQEALSATVVPMAELIQIRLQEHDYFYQEVLGMFWGAGWAKAAVEVGAWASLPDDLVNLMCQLVFLKGRDFNITPEVMESVDTLAVIVGHLAHDAGQQV